MGKVKKSITVSFLGAHEGLGSSFVSLNIAVDMALRGKKVVYGVSQGVNHSDDLSFLQVKPIKDDSEDFHLLPTKLDSLKVLSLSNDLKKLSPQKIEKLLHDLPKKVADDESLFIFDLEDPFSFPDRYVLLNTDIFVAVLKVSSSVFSDLFQILEKFAFFPVKPEAIYIIFNTSSDLKSAHETYLQILSKVEELGAKINIYFLGIVPYDGIRQIISGRLKEPFRITFPDSSVSGSLAFIADRITGKGVEKSTDEEESETSKLKQKPKPKRLAISR